MRYSVTIIALVATTALHAAPSSARTLVEALRSAVHKSTVTGQLPVAAVLAQGAWELSQQAPDLERLARLQVLMGDYDNAISSYDLLLKQTLDAANRKAVAAEVARLKRATAPLRDELRARPRATAFARKAFKRGLRLARKKKYARAICLLRAALVLDPVLPGTYRVLGGIYGKLDAKQQEAKFLMDYLRVRPDGRIANAVRRRLKKSGVLGSIRLEASFRSAIWINGRAMGLKTPAKRVTLPPGSYTVSFVHADYHIVRNMRVTLDKGEKRKLRFDFGVLQVKLSPWARVRASGRDLAFGKRSDCR
jgi:tetratricopeptide (TPR) repeat protein